MFHSSLQVPELKSAKASFAKSSSSPFCASFSNSLSHFRFSKVENQSRNLLKSFRDKLVTALSISVNVVIMRLVPYAGLFGLLIISLYLKKGRFGNRNFRLYRWSRNRRKLFGAMTLASRSLSRTAMRCNRAVS